MMAFLLLLAVPSSSEVLAHAGKAAQKFWEQFSAVTCTESVTQTKLNPRGKAIFQAESSYDYLTILQISGADFVVEESRMPIKAAKETATPLLVTNGFSTLLLIFHPFFQGGYEYAQPEAEQLDGKDVWRVRFRQAAGGRSPSVLKLRQREYPLEWSGTAWLDPASGAVVRIDAGLKSSLEDIGLKTLNASVRYSPMEFTEDREVHWLPVEASIEAETLRQHWRNVHRFSGFKRFDVKTKEQVEGPPTQ